MTRLGVDTGGTFTDLVWLDEADPTRVRTAKVPSRPDDPSQAVLAGLGELGALTAAEPPRIVHGTTVALNALLTGRGARVALVTGRGFRDLVEIGRQDRPLLYALEPRKIAPLVERELRFEIDARSAPDVTGVVREERRPSEEELSALRAELERSGAESVAVCLLHSYADPKVETRVAEALAPLGLPISSSARILPAYREFERFSTALVNAACVPILRRYLERLESALGGAALEIMQNSGGSLSAREAGAEPVRVLLSGPAGGVVGAARAAREAGLADIVTLDMGGTSTDVAFHRAGGGVEASVQDARVAGHPIAVPSLDLHTIGCGGGSIVHVDRGGVLHVGPRSAGADPGPVCYGRGEEPTVTDAHVLLGHVQGGEGKRFMGGALVLDTDRVRRAFETLGRRLGVTPEAAAQGVLDVARAAMRRALGVMTMQRGSDPARVPLVGFGGAGGLSAAALADSLGMPGALIPALPGVLSAYGMARADALRDHVCAVLAPLDEWPGERRRALLAELAERGREELRGAGHPNEAVEAEFALELRYRGQAYELAIGEGEAPAERFHAEHQRRYGWAYPGADLELVALRARALVRGPFDEPADAAAHPADEGARLGARESWFGGRTHSAAVWSRDRLRVGAFVDGPAVLEEFSATTIVPPGWRASVKPGGHVWLHRR